MISLTAIVYASPRQKPKILALNQKFYEALKERPLLQEFHGKKLTEQSLYNPDIYIYEIQAFIPKSVERSKPPEQPESDLSNDP